MTDRLADVGAEFRRLRAEAQRLKRRSAEVRERTNQLRPLLADLIVEDLEKGRSVTEIVKLTGYDRDSVRKIRLNAEQRRTGHQNSQGPETPDEPKLRSAPSSMK